MTVRAEEADTLETCINVDPIGEKWGTAAG